MYPQRKITMNTNLVSRFAGAGLTLRLADAPFLGAGSTDVFQVDIRRARASDARSEYFLAWPGRGDDTVQIRASDPREKQLVLTVREEGGSFEEAVPAWMLRQSKRPNADDTLRALARRLTLRPEEIVMRDDGAAFVRRSVSRTQRHLLAGRDERQLFMCELPRPCTSVKAAHDALRAPTVRKTRSALEAPVRQGEWFFLATRGAFLAIVEAHVAKSTTLVHRHASIGAFIARRGKPHVADELVVVPRAGVFVRGAVRHADHKTVHFQTFRQVVRNLEVDQARSVLGGTWID